MIRICSLCLSRDRKVLATTDNNWQIFISSLELDQIEYLKYLRSEELLKICWECHARIRNFSTFIRQSRESVKTFKEYLQCLSGVPPSSESRLQISEILITEVNPSRTEKQQNTALDATLAYSQVKIELSYSEANDQSTISNVEKCDVKIEDNVVDSHDYIAKFHTINPPADNHDDIDIDKFDTIDPPAENHDDIDVDKFDIDSACDSGDDDSGDRPLIEISQSNRLRTESITTKKNTKSKSSSKKLKFNVTKKYRAQPNCLVVWTSNEQAQQWYTQVRDEERACNPALTHTCDACDRSFASEANLKTHIEESHSEEVGEFTCNMCLYKFQNQGVLKQHVEGHYILYKCKLCSFETRLLSLMRDHNKKEHKLLDKEKIEKKKLEDVETCKCSRCKTIFGSKNLLKKHRSKCSVYKCEHCDKTFKYNPSYYQHLKTHRPTVEESLIYCKVCDTYFKSAKWYKQHFLKSLKHVSRDEFKHECKYCGMKFPIPRRLEEHIGSIHLKTGIYQCELCPKSYMTKGMLVRHRATQHNLGNIGKQKDKICDVCGKAFTSNHLLNNHMRSHTGEKPFKCEYCPAAFAQNGTLYTHSKVVHKKRISKTGHADSDRYRCEVCNKDFGTDARRRVHYEFYHLKNAKFSCQICDKNFISSTSLKNHNATRHGLLTSRYCCDLCGKTFNSASAKCQHLKTHSTERQLKCRSCDASFRNTGALYMHYKLKHLKLKRGDRVRIKNLCKSDEEIIVNRDVSS